MLKYKIDIADALDRIGFGGYDAKKTGFISQDTLKKLKAEDTAVSLEAINRLCTLLDMDIRDVLAWEMTEEDAQKRAVAVSGCKPKGRHARPGTRNQQAPGSE